MADQLFKIPFTSTPQRFEIELDGTTYIIANRWNDAGQGGWFIDLYDANESPLVMNIPLIPGVNLLAQYAYLGLLGVLAVVTDGDEFAEPTFTSLGSESNVFYLTPA